MHTHVNVNVFTVFVYIYVNLWLFQDYISLQCSFLFLNRNQSIYFQLQAIWSCTSWYKIPIIPSWLIKIWVCLLTDLLRPVYTWCWWRDQAVIQSQFHPTQSSVPAASWWVTAGDLQSSNSWGSIELAGSDGTLCPFAGSEDPCVCACNRHTHIQTEVILCNGFNSH